MADFVSPDAHEVEKQKTAMRSHPTFVMCPMCRKEGISSCTRKVSIVNCLFFTLCGGLWLLYGICNDKDPNCHDAKHDCAYCTNMLHEYKAC